MFYLKSHVSKFPQCLCRLCRRSLQNASSQIHRRTPHSYFLPGFGIQSLAASASKCLPLQPTNQSSNYASSFAISSHFRLLISAPDSSSNKSRSGLELQLGSCTNLELRYSTRMIYCSEIGRSRSASLSPAKKLAIVG